MLIDASIFHQAIDDCAAVIARRDLEDISIAGISNLKILGLFR